MSTIFFMIGFPLIVAIVLLVLKEEKTREIIVKLAAAVVAVGSIVVVARYFASGSEFFEVPNQEAVGYAMMGIEVCLALVVIFLGLKKGHYLAPLLAAIQTPLMIWFELTEGHGVEVEYALYLDRFNMIMILIVGIVGSLIAVYGLGYMKDFQEHHGGSDRRPWFFFLVFLFLAAMVGLVTSNNLIWMYFFWEVTSLCSFFLIGYNGLFHKKEEEDKEATHNAFRALWMNLLGGLGFCIGIILLGKYFGTLELSGMLLRGSMGGSQIFIPALFLCFAGITKCAQMPFSAWLRGAMVAPTPVSALLHSSTMVKAGVFLIIKLAPVLAGNFAGIMVSLVGGITFLMAAFAAISSSNGKIVLAYSTISNLGLIVCCGGVGTSAAVWAGIMLIVFHAVTKSLLFLCVGTAEHHIGSRDIEDMDGLFVRMPKLASCMLIGIAGMFLAPFGMLISKWATMVAFVNSGNILLMLIICFGSAATAFYWAKWIGKLSAVEAGQENIEGSVHKEERFVHYSLTVLTVLLCLVFPFLSSVAVEPYLQGKLVFGEGGAVPMGDQNLIIMCIMVAFLILLFAFLYGKTNKTKASIYMAGINEGDDLTFENSMFQPVQLEHRNWYLEKYFGADRMNFIGNVATILVIAGIMGTICAKLFG